MIGVPRAVRIVSLLVACGRCVVAPASGQPGDPSSPLLAEWLVPGATPAEVLAAARTRLEAEGFRIARADRGRGLLETRARAYVVDAWPPASDLKLPPSQRPTAAAVHLFVSPEFVPARVAISVVLDVDDTFAPLPKSKNRATLKYYSNPALSSYFASRIGDRNGWALTPLAGTAEARAAQVADLPARRPAGCGAAPLLPSESRTAPTLISQVKPIYPRIELRRYASGEVMLTAEVTEHGTLAGIVANGGLDNPNLVAAARGAAALWRFRAPVVDGCPARRQITIAMDFILGR
jgi:TonB family protein